MLTDERIYALWAAACNDPVAVTLTAFARAVEAEARKAALEEAAKVCDPPKGTKWASENSDRYHIQDEWGRKCAAAIRALIDRL